MWLMAKSMRRAGASFACREVGGARISVLVRLSVEARLELTDVSGESVFTEAEREQWYESLA